MLSNTYVRIVCSNESNSIRGLLRKLEAWNKGLDKMDGNGMSLSGLVKRIEKERKARRYEKYILPFLEAENVGNGALKDIYKAKDDLAVSYASLMPVLDMAMKNRIEWKILLQEIRRYCELNRRLLDLEETGLGVPVQTNVSEDVWFSLAENFIREDKAHLDEKYQNKKDVFDLISGNGVRKQDIIKSEYRV